MCDASVSMCQSRPNGKMTFFQVPTDPLLPWRRNLSAYPIPFLESQEAIDSASLPSTIYTGGNLTFSFTNAKSHRSQYRRVPVLQSIPGMESSPPTFASLTASRLIRRHLPWTLFGTFPGRKSIPIERTGRRGRTCVRRQVGHAAGEQGDCHGRLLRYTAVLS